MRKYERAIQKRIHPEVRRRETGTHAECEIVPYFFVFLGGIICCHFLLIVGLSFRHLLTYKADIDAAQFNHIFWALLHSGIPTMAVPPPVNVINWFGAVHFSPIFYIFLPLYALWPSPFILQILHCCCLSCTAVPVAMTLRRLALNDKIILALVVMLLFNPFYFDAGIWEFHEISIGCLLMASSYWALIAGHKKGFLLALFLLLMTKEHFGLSVAGFGYVWWRRYRDGKFGLLIAIAGIASFLLILGFLMPWLNNGLLHPMLRVNGMPRYAWPSANMQDMFYNLVYLFFSPNPYNAGGIMYLAVLFLTVGFFCLLSPLYLLPGIADFATILLSSESFPRFLAAYHSAVLIPVLIVASGITIARYRKSIPRALPLYQLLVLFIVLLNIALFPKNAITAYELGTASPMVNFQVADKIKSIIGNKSVSAQSNIALLLSPGPSDVYPFPSNRYNTEFVVLYLRHPYKVAYYRVFGDIYFLPAGRHYSEILNLLENSPQWGIVLWEDNWLVLKKNTADQLPVRQEIVRRVQSMLETADSVKNSDVVWTPNLP